MVILREKRQDTSKDYNIAADTPVKAGKHTTFSAPHLYFFQYYTYPPPYWVIVFA
ncbi:hypothetical protein BGLY_0669 [Bacillus glycinifermentans]|nr:hypothetical protein BGLY_0669 [Bacillus glycinifermentans]